MVFLAADVYIATRVVNYAPSAGHNLVHYKHSYDQPRCWTSDAARGSVSTLSRKHALLATIAELCPAAAGGHSSSCLPELTAHQLT